MESLNIKEKRPKAIADFLRKEFNFGDKKDESDQAVVKDFIEYMKVRANERLLMNEPSWADLIADELEKAGIVESGELSHKIWTPEHEQILNEIFKSL